MRLDSSGRLLVGTSSARSNLYNANYAPVTQIETTGTLTQRTLSLTYNANGAGAGGAVLSLVSSNGGDSSNTIVSNNQELGSVNFLGTDGTKPLAGASIVAFVDGTPGANDMPGRIVLSTTKDGQSSPTAAVTIDSSQRLLVGTSSSVSNVYLGGNAHQQPVQVVTATNSYANGLTALNYSASGFAPVISLGLSKSNSLGSNTAVASGDDLGIINFTGNDGTNFRSGAFILAAADGGVSTGDLPTRLVFSTTADGASSPTERMRISNSGFTNLFVTADDGFQSRNSAAAGTTIACFVGRHSATGTGDGTISFQVWTNGNVQNTNNSYGAISDLKLKENIVDAGSQWSDIKALQVRKYNFKEGQTHTQIGLIAQEVEIVSPGLVTESPDRDEEGNNLGTVTKSVNYSVLYMKAVKALQEAMERIETLEDKVAALESA